MKVANIGTSSRKLVVQGGTFGEHRLDSVDVVTDTGTSTYAIGDKWWGFELAGGTGATLNFTVSRYANAPSYETPFSLRSEWDPIIQGRPANNFN